MIFSQPISGRDKTKFDATSSTPYFANTNVVCSQDDYEEFLKKLAGIPSKPLSEIKGRTHRFKLVKIEEGT